MSCAACTGTVDGKGELEPLIKTDTANVDPSVAAEAGDTKKRHFRHTFPTRVRFPGQIWILYAGMLVESLVLIFTCPIQFLISPGHYAALHCATAVPRILIYMYISTSFAGKVIDDKSIFCNKLMCPLDTLQLLGCVSFGTYCGMMAQHVLSDSGVLTGDKPMDNFLQVRFIPEFVSIFTNLFTFLSVNFYFRCTSLLFKFTKREYITWKFIQFLNILILLTYGIMVVLFHAAYSVKHKGATTLYIFALLLWHREFFATLSRMDSTNKFVGVLGDYKLLGDGDGEWHVRTEAEEDELGSDLV